MDRRLISSSGLDPATASEYDRVDFWIAERERLDRVLQKPALSLIRIAEIASERGIDTPKGKVFTIPTTFDETNPRIDESPLIHAVACSAIQRLDNQQRRFSWLKPHRKTLERLRKDLPAGFVAHPALRSKNPLETLEALPDVAFGMLSPLVSAEVFWVLVRAGENYAHGDLGFLALFSLLWALNRRTHGPFELGAPVGRWRPTVAVTARCLMPILTLLGIVQTRARLWTNARDVCDLIEKNAAGRNQWERWAFASELDHLAAVLHELEEISIEPRDFHEAADQLTQLASPLTPHTTTAPRGPRVRQTVRDLLMKLRNQNADVLAKAEKATRVVQQAVLDVLSTDGAQRDELAHKASLFPDWPLQYDAAKRANDVCVRALRELQSAVALCDRLPQGDAFTHEILLATLEELAAINTRVHGILKGAIDDNLEWCVRGIDREVAFASARNDTEFDAAELLSGVIIGERRNRISSIEATDAIRHSLRSAHEDGSWWSGQPFFLEKRVLGVWPSTPDVVLLLATAVKAFDDIDVADAHLRRFIDWLEIRSIPQSPEWWKRISREPLWGWSSEAREPGIDVWTTATAVKALLEIRGVIEDRLWSICENRFTVLGNLKKLTEIDPVDLGARHGVRLQTRLLRNAAKARLDEDDAEYSYMLHGPPGSSKSVLGQAIGREMWSDGQGSGRFVRITPADFTRRGESGLDVEARFIFRLLSHVRGVTIFFDEIDDFLRVREVGAEPAFIRLVIPGMLNRLQDLRDAASAQEICFLLGTNYIDQIEPALIRPGRIDLAIAVPYPDAWSRHAILEKNAPDVDAETRDWVVEHTVEWPWSTYQKLCKRLRGKPRMSRVEELVSELRMEFQAPDYYYLNPKRWTTSSPLDTELVHVAFSASKNAEACRNRLRELVRQLPKEKDLRVTEETLIAKFDTEWRREGR
ncbi:MAG TPA: ATP-binding protein [Thermoanaerobaculia bacterium]|nr:ATP-binding protein [Thermoanaerobaculia bacterium]